MNSVEPLPLVVIEPTRRLAALRLGELWAYRELLYFLVWRDVKVRYKQTALGAAWAILQPLMTAAVFTIFFGRLAGIASDGLPYPLFSYGGLLVWTFFAQGLSQSSNSVVGSAQLITPDSASAHVEVTVTSRLCQPAALAAGVTVAAIVGGVVVLAQRGELGTWFWATGVRRRPAVQPTSPTAASRLVLENAR